MRRANDKTITFKGSKAYAEYFQTLVFLNKSTEGYFFLWDYQLERVFFASEIESQYALDKTVGEGYSMEECMHIVYKRDMTKWAQDLWKVHEMESDIEKMEFRLVDRDGRLVWVSCRGRVVRDKWDKPLVMTGSLTEADLMHKTDSLTGLMNTSKLFEVLEDGIQKKEEGILLLLGIDNFKNLNKRYGRNRGNEILKKTARVLELCVDSQYQVYRLDGDRFAVDFLGCHRDTVVEVYHRVQKKMKEFCTLSGGGVHYSSRECKDASTLFLYAESALDRAKKNGKNRLLFFSPEDYKKQLYLIELTEEMQASINNGFKGFSLCYQPQVRMNDYQIAGAEALLRFHSEKYGLVSPEEFIGLLEQNGMIIPVGAWVLKEGIRQCKEWRKLQPNFHMSINVSYIQLQESGLTEYIYQLLDEQQLPGGAITLEVTESMQLQEYTTFNQLFYQWGSRGIEISIDDFGTGYSSLSYLKSLAIDEIKIDRCFVSHIHLSSYNFRLLNNILELAKSAKIRVCCEGVETEEELQTLERLMPGILQGYYFSKPLEKEMFEQLYLKSHERQKEWEKKLEQRAQQTTEEPVEDADYKKMLDLMEEIVYVVDMDTYELYYMNPAARHLTGHNDYMGEKCYQAIYGLNHPCPYCCNEKMMRKQTVFHANDTELGKRLLMQNKMIHWKDKTAKLEVGIDTSMLDDKWNTMECEREISETAVSLLEELSDIRNMQQAVQKILDTIGRFYQAQRSILFIHAQEEAAWRGLFVWNGEHTGVQSEVIVVPDVCFEPWKEEFEEEKGVAIDDIEQCCEYDKQKQQILDLLEVRSLLLVPVWLEQKAIGMLCVENADYMPTDTRLMEKMAPFMAKILKNGGLLDARDESLSKMSSDLMDADVLGALKVGLWTLESDTNAQVTRMSVDKNMDHLLGVTKVLDPEDYYLYWYQHIQEEYKDYVGQSLNEMVRSGEIVEMEYIWNHPQQGKISVCCVGVCSQQKNGVYTMKGYHYQSTRIQRKAVSENKTLQRATLRRNDFYSAVLKELAAYAEVDLQTGILTDAGGIWSDYKPDLDKDTCSLDTLFEQQIWMTVLPEDSKLCQQNLTLENFKQAFQEGTDTLSFQFRCMMDRISYHWMELHVHMYQESGTKKAYALCYLKDIDSVKRHSMERELTASRDLLTNVLTRRMFEYHVVQYMREETIEGEQAALLLFDISQLQKINEHMGHQVGDIVLTRFAGTLRDTFRKSDYIGRLGGDEFIVFLKAPILKEMLDWRIEQLIEKMQQKTPMEFSCHIGIDLLKKEEFNYERNIRHVEKAMKASCEKGKNTFVYYEELKAK
ncbi:MAG: EAL domain-containing protein [Lachnospiraceae bacterium]